MYAGGFLKNEIGHEAINLFKSDNGKHYIFIGAHGVVGKKHKKNTLSAILLVKRINKTTVEIEAKVYPKTIDEKMAEFLFCDDLETQRKLVAEYIRENKISYAGLSLNEVFNDDWTAFSFSPISFEVSAIYKPKTPLYLTKTPNLKDERHIYLSDGAVSSRSLHWFYIENSKESKTAFAIVKEIVKREDLWESFEPSALAFEEEADFMSIIRQETNELAYSNMLQFFFRANKSVFHRFAKEVLHAEITGNYSVEREKNNIDLLITDTKNIIVIENKIEAKLENHQLQKYAETAKKMSGGRKIGLFVLSPDYNDIGLKEVMGGKEYAELKYSQLYAFFSRKENNIQSKYFADFLYSLKIHSETLSDRNLAMMRQRITRLIKNTQEETSHG